MKRYTSVLAAGTVGFILLIFSVFYQDIGNAEGTADRIRILSNAALVPGVLLTGTGLIARISEEGIFDGMKYAISSLMSHLRNESKHSASYYDYLQREKKKGGLRGLFLPGIFYLVSAAVLTFLYYII